MPAGHRTVKQGEIYGEREIGVVKEATAHIKTGDTTR